MPYIDEDKWNKVLNLLEKYGQKEKAQQWHARHKNISRTADCRQQGVWAGAGSKGDSDDLALGFGFFIRSVAHGRVVSNTPDWVKDAFNRALAEGADATGGVMVPEIFIPELGCATRLLPRGRGASAVFPVLLELTVAVQRSKVQDGLSSWVGPAHA